MIKRCYLGVVLSLSLSSSSALAQPEAGDQVKNEGQLVQDLSGFSWKLKRMRPGQGVREGLHELPQADIETLVWMPARVPGDVYTDLWKAGALDDPYWGRNSMKAQWVMYEEGTHSNSTSVKTCPAGSYDWNSTAWITVAKSGSTVTPWVATKGCFPRFPSTLAS